MSERTCSNCGASFAVAYLTYYCKPCRREYDRAWRKRCEDQGLPSQRWREPSEDRRVYMTWANAKSRCRNPKCKEYSRYGGRGIAFDQRWDSFEQFNADMGPRPPGHSLDRIDNDGPYSPENCRWATRSQQNRNTRKTRRYYFDGQWLCVADLSDRTGVSRATITTRLRLGWSVERAVTEPTRKKKAA